MRRCRKLSDLNQQQLGERLELSRQMINSYENDRALPPPGTLEKICNLYGVKPWWLLYGVGSPYGGLQDIAQKEDEDLSNVQRMLIDYIRANKNFADQLAITLWNKTLNP